MIRKRSQVGEPKRNPLLLSRQVQCCYFSVIGLKDYLKRSSLWPLTFDYCLNICQNRMILSTLHLSGRRLLEFSPTVRLGDELRRTVGILFVYLRLLDRTNTFSAQIRLVTDVCSAEELVASNHCSLSQKILISLRLSSQFCKRFEINLFYATCIYVTDTVLQHVLKSFELL